MDRGEAVGKVIEAISNVQKRSGRKVDNIGPNTHPFRDVEDFDSHNGVEVALFLSESLDCDLPDTVFTPAKGKRILTVNEIADNVLRYVSGGAER